MRLRAEPRTATSNCGPFGWSLVSPSDAGSAEDLDGLCIDAGFGLVSAPVCEKFLPQMLGLTDIGAVSFDKGCYLGQEVVARAQHRGEVKRRIRRFRYRGAAPTPGTATSPSGIVVHARAASDDSGDALVVTGTQQSALSAPGCEFQSP